MKRSILGVLLTLIIVFTLSCDKSKLKKGFEKGYLEYSIKYDKTSTDKINHDLLPKTMLIKFYNHSILNKVEAMSGSVSFTYIVNKEIQKNILLIKLMNKKLVFEEPIVKGRFQKVYSEMPKLLITKTNKKLKYEGFNCQHAVGTFLDSTNRTFDIYYTKEINIDNPNANTPYEDIDGVMLKFDIKLYNRVMELSVKKVKARAISFDEFGIPSDYESINEETIQDIISLLQ